MDTSLFLYELGWAYYPTWTTYMVTMAGEKSYQVEYVQKDGRVVMSPEKEDDTPEFGDVLVAYEDVDVRYFKNLVYCGHISGTGIWLSLDNETTESANGFVVVRRELLDLLPKSIKAALLRVASYQTDFTVTLKSYL